MPLSVTNPQLTPTASKSKISSFTFTPESRAQAYSSQVWVNTMDPNPGDRAVGLSESEYSLWTMNMNPLLKMEYGIRRRRTIRVFSPKSLPETRASHKDHLGPRLWAIRYYVNWSKQEITYLQDNERLHSLQCHCTMCLEGSFIHSFIPWWVTDQDQGGFN